MKKILILALVSAVMTTASFGRTEPAAQSLSFSSPSQWIPGTTVTLNVFLTFSGYSSYALSYWLEVPNAIAPFLSITNVQYFTFPDPVQQTPNPVFFNSTTGAISGYRSETRDLGASVHSVQPGNAVPPGTYQISQLTLSLDPALPLTTFTMFSTMTLPRVSAVVDTAFNDNNIIPPGQFVVAIIPEPSTFSLLALAAGLGGVILSGAKRGRKI